MSYVAAPSQMQQSTEVACTVALVRAMSEMLK
jgi:hypothetical protein